VAQTWGIAILKAQANLPDTLPGQNVTFLIFGGAALDNITPQMRTVSLQTSVSSTTCTSAPDSGLLVQSPEGTQATLTINGANLTLGSTAYLKALQQSEMTIATIEGSAVVSSFNTTRIVQPGAQVKLPLGGSNGLQVAGPPSEPEPFNATEISRIPLPLLERQVQVPPPITTSASPATSTSVQTCIPRSDWNFAYVVQSGDTLFRIAQNFGVSVQELQQANCISNVNQIQVGQTIRVPGALATNTPSATIPPTNVPVPTASDPNLRADQTLIQLGECTTIRWDASNVSQVFFQGQPTSGNSSQQVCPTSDTTYTLLVVYTDGRQTPYAIRIQVVLPPDAQQTEEPLR
jgi:LysM repeat protein